MTEQDKEPKGGLVISISDTDFVQVGDVKIYLKSIKVSGTRGGKKIVELRFIGPRAIPIMRMNR
jgi:hypothetical protein